MEMLRARPDLARMFDEYDAVSKDDDHYVFPAALTGNHRLRSSVLDVLIHGVRNCLPDWYKVPPRDVIVASVDNSGMGLLLAQGLTANHIIWYEHSFRSLPIGWEGRKILLFETVLGPVCAFEGVAHEKITVVDITHQR
jgi:hypothetical protein